MVCSHCSQWPASCQRRCRKACTGARVRSRVLLLRHMAQVVEDHQLAAGDVLLELLCHRRRHQAVASAPQDQRRQLQLADALGILAAAVLLQPLHQRAAVAFAQRQLVVAVDQGIVDPRRVAIDVAHAGHHHRPRQHPLGQPVEHRHARQHEADGHRIRLEVRPGRIHQDQLGDALRRHQRGAPGDLAAERIAGDGEALHLQLVHQVEHEARVGVAAVVAAGIGPGQAEAGQVEADDAVPRAAAP